jgi:hypothetical protein
MKGRKSVIIHVTKAVTMPFQVPDALQRMTERQGRQIDNESSGTENILAVWRHTSQELDIVLHPTGLADECVDNILLQSRAPEHQSCALDSLLDLFANISSNIHRLCHNINMPKIRPQCFPNVKLISAAQSH